MQAIICGREYYSVNAWVIGACSCLPEALPSTVDTKIEIGFGPGIGTRGVITINAMPALSSTSLVRTSILNGIAERKQH